MIKMKMKRNKGQTEWGKRLLSEAMGDCPQSEGSEEWEISQMGILYLYRSISYVVVKL